MSQQYILTKSIIRTIGRIRPSLFNHVNRHFQSKTPYLSIAGSTNINNLFRKTTYSPSNLNLKHWSSNPSRTNGARKHRQASVEADDEGIIEDDINDEGHPSSDFNNEMSDHRDSSFNLSDDDSNNESHQLPNVNTAFTGANSFSMRSHSCGELNLNHEGQKVSLYGWIEAKRGDNFIILRDAYGSVQICLAGYTGKVLESSVPPESVIKVVGSVVKRTPEHVNKEMATGEIEVQPTEINVLNTVEKRLPFALKGYNMPKENLRLKHRYLHFRFPEMQRTLRLRSNMLHKMRRFLVEDCSFVEVETPTLFGKTPGGAQEFVVPTKHKGKCYSLVQSPQQFKQMLMVGGLDRYFQVARCYRDEDSRADRQPEFTQLDLELSFADMDGVINLTEQILKHSWPEGELGPLKFPFPRFKYEEALCSYGTDKPDLRYPMTITDYSKFFTAYFQFLDRNNLRVLTYVGKGSCYSEDLQKEVDKIIAKTQSERQPASLVVFPYKDLESFRQNLSPVLNDRVLTKLFSVLHSTHPGDLVVLAFGWEETVLRTLGAVRVPIAKMCGIQPSHRFSPLWVTHFPLLEKGPLIGQFKSVHHPFTNIMRGCEKMFIGSPLSLVSLSYDLVINGLEIGGGSERIYDVDFQTKVLQKLKVDPKDFDHFLNALSYGCPPHAGIALGVDRLLACLLDTDSIRDVIAFPKTVDGAEPLTGAPFTPSKEDKARYKLK